MLSSLSLIATQRVSALQRRRTEFSALKLFTSKRDRDTSAAIKAWREYTHSPEGEERWKRHLARVQAQNEAAVKLFGSVELKMLAKGWHWLHEQFNRWVHADALRARGAALWRRLRAAVKLRGALGSVLADTQRQRARTNTDDVGGALAASAAVEAAKAANKSGSAAAAADALDEQEEEEATPVQRGRSMRKRVSAIGFSANASSLGHLGAAAPGATVADAATIAAEAAAAAAFTAAAATAVADDVDIGVQGDLRVRTRKAVLSAAGPGRGRSVGRSAWGVCVCGRDGDQPETRGGPCVRRWDVLWNVIRRVRASRVAPRKTDL